MTHPLPALTKRHINKLYKASPTVQLTNGCYNVVSCKVKCNKRLVEVCVEVTHPSLYWQCGNKESVSIADYITTSAGIVYDGVPEVLEPLVEKMKALGKMDDDFAEALSSKNTRLFTTWLNEMGISKERTC